MPTVKGYVEHIIYRNNENGYTVMEVLSGEETYTLVGTLPSISEGEPLEAEGSFVTHPVYGEQLKVESYQVTEPEDAVSIERYLGSGAIKGVGPSLAHRIVKKFKADTLRILDEEPERLAEVKGISENGARQIAVQVAEKRELRQAMIYLQQFGISLNLAVKIYERYGPGIYTMIQTNPYQMAEDIPGVGFRIADDIARRAGIQTDSDFRIRSGLYYTLMRALSSGHVYLPEEILLKNAAALLEVSSEGMEQQIMDLVLDKRLVVKNVQTEEDPFGAPAAMEDVLGWDDALPMPDPKGQETIVYSAMYYYMEMKTARMLLDLNVSFRIRQKKLEEAIRRVEEEEQIDLDDLQRSAVATVIQNGVSVITGGPGTGKTTTINTVLRYFEREEKTVLLAAPTGRAAKRMTEATGCEARTIHRLLEFNGKPDETHEDDESYKFERNENNPLECDVIIIDEMSMVDINLMYSLLKAIVPGTRLVLVGDASQLPSVGPGNVLRDILRSGCFPVVELTRIFRQEEASDIVVNAHKIHDGEPIDAGKRSKDFLFVRRYDANHIINAVITLVRDKLPDYVKADPFEIQVLTPMRKGMLGVENLNKILQEFLNPPSDKKKEKQFAHAIFREGDKVMQIRNNYQLEWEVRGRYRIAVDQGTGIFNGDMGIIREINLFTEEFEVEFDENRMVTYSFKQADELELAYAVTVHKSQGSEYPAVVIPLLSGPEMLMNRNLIYTAVTRAKTCVCIVGPVETFQHMADNTKEQRRYSGLDRCLREIQAGDEDTPDYLTGHPTTQPATRQQDAFTEDEEQFLMEMLMP